jgi:hypothetical protein
MKSTVCNDAYNGSSTLCCIQFDAPDNSNTESSDILYTEEIFSLNHCQ